MLERVVVRGWLSVWVKEICLPSQERPDLQTMMWSVPIELADEWGLTKNPSDQTSAEDPSGSSWQRYRKLG